MRKWGLAFAAMLFVLCFTPALAFATMRITEDHGGQIGHYLQAFAMLRSSGEDVVIDGDCLSACTLVLGTIPRNRICATPNARLGFHAAWMPDAEGRPVTSALGTRVLWHVYPRGIRHWIARHGGLSRRMIFLQGPALYDFVPRCSSVAHYRETHSRRWYASHHLRRYYSASAARDRR